LLSNYLIEVFARIGVDGWLCDNEVILGAVNEEEVFSVHVES
jgi:hypothetical protein